MATRDKAGRPIVVVTGMGIVTSLGTGKDENWAKLTAGESGIRRITRFDTAGLRTTIAGTVDHVYTPGMEPSVLSETIAWLAGEEAVAESRLGGTNSFPGPLFLAMPPLAGEWCHRLALSEGAPAGHPIDYGTLIQAASSGRFADFYERAKFGIVGEHLAERFGTQGSPISLTTACASGATSIQLGVEAIRRGECSAALVIGADGSVTPESVVRFSLLSALSTSNDVPAAASRPFSKNRDGFVVAEGAAALVLEDYDRAVARGARIVGVLEGCGEKGDSFRPTRSRPEGKPIIGCIPNPLAEAGVEPE